MQTSLYELNATFYQRFSFAKAHITVPEVTAFHNV